MTLSQRIKCVRQNSGKSQRDVAEVMGVSQQAYQGFEADAKNSKICTINRFCSAMKIDVAFLLSDIPISDRAISIYGRATYNHIVLKYESGI